LAGGKQFFYLHPLATAISAWLQVELLQTFWLQVATA